MKKMTFLACAVLCTSAMVLSSCQKGGDEPSKKPEVIKAEFSIALPNQLKSGANKMPSATAQVAGSEQFQGITEIKLVPFDKQGEISSADARLGANISLVGDVAKADILKPSAAKVYTDVNIPLSTASFLFYAKSAATGTKFEVGSLTASNLDATNPSSFHFDLEQIQPIAGALTAASADGGKLLQYLTNIAIAEDDAHKAWCNYTNDDNAAMKAMFDTYSSIHGLSSFEVERVLTDLNKSLKPLDASNSLAHAIRLAIADATYATVNASDEVELIAALDNFPGSYNLPDGAIDIRWDDPTDKFVVGNYVNMATPDKYVYPAQLWYYVNSQIKTSNSSKQTMYDNVNDWAAILGAHGDAISVNSLTRAVAIKDPVQYAVARLDVQARVKEASLEDNSASVEGIRKDVDCSAGFPISAVLVGGQQQVNFDFTANTSAPEYAIYDNVMTSTRETSPATMLAPASATVYSAMNHTLVLENGTGDVMIALELTNTTGVDFYGVGGQLIPKNGKFYVVAKLEANDATETNKHVFKQDYVTTAKLALKDLKSAYSTIPDLRTPKLELGFSVDLTWQTGHTYTVDFQ